MEEEVINQMRKVLIIDDDEAYAGILKLKMEQEGYEVHTISDGAKAYEDVKKMRPDVVLLDLIMPNHDGFEILGELKGDEATKDIPVFVFSNLSEDSDVQRVTKLGGEKYLVKSDVSVNEVVSEVQSRLSK